MQHVADNPGCSQNAIETAISGRAQDIRLARDRAVEQGLIKVEKDGKRRSHTLCSSTRPNSSGRTDDLPDVPRPLVLYEDEVRGVGTQDPLTERVPDEMGPTQCTTRGDPLAAFWTEQGITVHPGCRQETA